MLPPAIQAAIRNSSSVLLPQADQVCSLSTIIQVCTSVTLRGLWTVGGPDEVDALDRVSEPISVQELDTGDRDMLYGMRRAFAIAIAIFIAMIKLN